MECLKDWNEAALHFTSCYLLFVKIGFFYRINMALKRGQIDSELFGLRITECNLIKGKNEHLL